MIKHHYRVIPNSHETAFPRTSPLKAILAIGSGIRPSLFFSDYLRVFSGPGGCLGSKPWRVCKGTDLPAFYRRRSGYILTIASLRYQTSWNCQTTPGHVQNKPTRIAHALGSIPRAHRPIAIIDQPTGPVIARTDPMVRASNTPSS
ncbi:hypothetical protein F2Q69_00042363 [Brassica cretica]|uniref:Uncharacterized protein n=1 Tax=Brassica cretica TaxID=69181 RepID=A0A8S9NJD5_BRACR|nr:hypothetical protein F2Q69_00042363 [Brassica cretica]